MAKIENKTKENPKLQQSTLSDGRISLYLEYYMGRTESPVLDELGEQVYYETGLMKGKPKKKIVHHRKKENLRLYLTDKPRTPIERQQNKETLEIAKKIRHEREQQLMESKEGYRLKKERSINFLDYFQAYIDKYTKKDIKMVRMALRRFNDFLKASDNYAIYTKSIKPEQLTKDMMVDFVEYLQSRSVGEGAKAVYQRFKKVVKYAVEHDIIKKNPCTGVVCKIDENILRKDILSVEEMQTLISTTYINQNDNIRRAFIFTLYTGVRFCDVNEMTYANVDYSNRLLKFEQNKSKGKSQASGVIIPLNDGLINLIGQPQSEEPGKELIFDLPSDTMCLKALRRWTKRAGINKHITWHCGRHSFAVNILNNGANIKTVASLLGHSGLKHTEKYTRAVDSLKEAAINSLPELNI